MLNYPYKKVFLKNILFNYRIIKKHTAPAKVMAVIKADAYGHGMLQVAEYLAKEVDYFFVDRLKNAIALRKQKISAPILLGSLLPQEMESCTQNNIDFVLGDFAGLSYLEKNQHLKAKIHLKVDSGFGRLGFLLKDLEQVITRLKKFTNVKLQGVMSHLARAEDKLHSHNQLQIKNFEWVEKKIKNSFSQKILFHLLNSGGIINFSKTWDMVRTGLLLYGAYHAGFSQSLHLKPCLEVGSCILSIKKISKGTGVSYNHSWKSKKAGNLALIGVGYSDGVLRSFSNKAKTLIGEKKYSMVGNICMGITAVDLGEDIFPVGEEVILLGKRGSQKISPEDLAIQSGSITHEVLTSITRMQNE